jgi:beta-glucosidase
VVRDPELEARVSVFGKPTYRDNRPESALISEAIAVANKSDVIIAAMGEAAEMSGECSSRSDIELPENQRNLLKALVKTGKPIVLVLFNGRPLAIKWESENINSILDVWFGGSQAGHAIADVLFGEANPSGKLTMTFPRNVGQIPVYYNNYNTGRPLPGGEWFTKFTSNYLDIPNDPVYPFGYGLSYTTFAYGDIVLSDTTLNASETLKVSVDVTNSGNCAGKEVVQLYIRDLVGSIVRPLKELKGFRKIYLEPGQTKTVNFELSTDDLKFYNFDLNYVWEPGAYNIMVGGNSRDVQSVRVVWNN